LLFQSQTEAKYHTNEIEKCWNYLLKSIYLVTISDALIYLGLMLKNMKHLNFKNTIVKSANNIFVTLLSISIVDFVFLNMDQIISLQGFFPLLFSFL